MLPNTSIGNDTVIGIGSIITKPIPSNCMAAGTPCKVIRQDCYPKAVSDDELERLVTSILERWQTVLVPQKAIDTVSHLQYDKSISSIVLLQGINSTFYNVKEKTITGYEDSVSEDLRDFLRRNGIKIFTGNPFKSI
jgi:hypothetical protein